MYKRTIFNLSFIILASTVLLWGCPKKTEVSSSPTAQEQAANQTGTKQEVKEEAKPTATTETKTETAAETAPAAAAGLQPVYFDFDKSFVRADAEAVMKANAEWLKANPNVKVKIEGNCDARGTIEYNQALGQRRAASAKKYLVDLGIASSRISLISYGKEKQVCSEETEDCWQKNRRDDFVSVK